jgi:hypothetical protein
MADSDCETCAFRARYDNKSKSFLRRLWRWHANWCPGWKEYMNSLEKEKRQKIATQYGMKKYMN